MIYLDNNATTRLDPRVLEAMMPFLTNEYANAASTHPFGLQAHEAVKLARQQVTQLLGCEQTELIFTSGATEAINLAIKGVAESYADRGRHIITVQTEHTAVLDVCRYLATRGFEVTFLPVQEDGLLEVNTLKQALRSDTILVSVMAVNNETGVIQPLRELAELSHAAGALFMTDATQAVGKMPLDVEALGIDLLTFSGHKLYGPKGVGALYVRQRKPRRVKIGALLHGGGHERGWRSGTLNVPGIVGLGQAAELCRQSMVEESSRIGALRDNLEAQLLLLPGTRVNGNIKHRLYNTTNICFEGCDSDALIMGLDDMAVSNGSACTAASIDPSHVLMAMGLTEAEAFSCLRFSLGRFNEPEQITTCVAKIDEEITKLRMYT
jgi:cysteine desulfurase